MTLKTLYKCATKNGIDIDYFELNNLTAVSIPGSIAINPKAVHNSKEEKVVLAHELGHQLRNAFYNISTSLETKERMEYRADRWAIKNLIPFPELLNALKNGITERWELAEHFNVTEDYIDKAHKLYEEELLKLCS